MTGEKYHICPESAKGRTKVRSFFSANFVLCHKIMAKKKICRKLNKINNTPFVLAKKMKLK
ncbi:hypothetical protein HMPREF9996_00703 [Aggregatibacter actinomycetemcomitans Y4]|nr:hypothetical protein HMPREF9996_00703 [Aggregatibacter actinomycetemcomitans Y4]